MNSRKVVLQAVSLCMFLFLVSGLAVVFNAVVPSGIAYAQGSANCPDCSKPLTYVEDYKRWYCESEGKYMDAGFDPNKKKTPPPPPPAAKKLPPPPTGGAKLPPPPTGGTKLPPPPAGAPRPAAVTPTAGTVVFSFDTLDNFAPTEGSDETIDLSTDYSTEGDACFKLTCEGGDYPGFELYEGGFTNSDWTGYTSMLLDVYNEGPDMRSFGMLIDNEARDRFTQDEIMLKNGANTVKVDLRRAAGRLKNNLKIRMMVLYIEGQAQPPVKLPLNLYIDNMRLVK